MSFVETFDSFEDAQAELASRVEIAKQQIKDFQQIFLDGKSHYFLRLVAFCADVLLIVGHTIDVEENGKEMAAKYPEDWSPEETAGMWENLANGFAFTKCYSVAEPNGELGDTHIATMLEISKEDFELCQEHGFNLADVMGSGNPELLETITKWITDVHFQ